MKLPLNGAEYAPYKRVHISSQMWCSSGMWNFAHQCCIEVVKIIIPDNVTWYTSYIGNNYIKLRSLSLRDILSAHIPSNLRTKRLHCNICILRPHLQ